ncbi:MAG: SIR2 family protein [Anaerolineae bacterium]|nr:SIR2 family protein [Anaerolineae bacterium]
MTNHTQLLEALDHGALTLFLGADVPQTVTGLPSRADLARGLAQRHGLGATLSLAQVAQRVSRAGNRFDFTNYLRRELDTAGKPVPVFYRNLAAFAKAHTLPAIITTAYDDLLERALRDAGVPFDRLVRGSDVAFARPDRLALIKLYGDVQMPDTLVVTEDDHYGLWRDRDKESLLDEVRALLKKQTVLFLGYNLSDPDFNLLWREVLDKMGRFARTAYAVWPSLPEEEQRVWRDRMIQVLDADPWGLAGSHVEVTPQPQVSEVPMAEAPGISPQLYDKLQTILLRCGPFRSDNALSPLFVDSRISQWRDMLPSRDNPAERVQAVIEKLSERSNAQGENALVLLLRVLRDRTSPGDACYGQLDALADDLAASLSTPSLKPVVQTSKGDGAVAREHKVYGEGKAWAVLAGVNHYDDPYIADLKVCVDDVTAIQQSLIGRYQAARLLTDATPEHLPTRANILGELSTVAQTADEDDLLLFYFSGHGMAEGGESYLLARDTRLAALKHTALAMKDVREIIEQSPAHAKVIVLDACHSGASIGKAEPTMTPEFIQRVFEEAEGMAVLASCKQGQQSWEWQEERRSVFTYYLLEALSGKADRDGKGFVTVSDASRHVTDKIKAWAVDRGVPQTPTLQYTVAGDIILLRY